MIANPAVTMVDEAHQIGDALGDSVGKFEVALSRKAEALRTHLSAKQMYEDRESEFVFAMSLEDSDYASAKNAPDRASVRDYKLVKARQAGGKLADAWRIYIEATNAKDDAQMEYDQCEARFKAVRVRAELQSSMLRSLSN